MEKPLLMKCPLKASDVFMKIVNIWEEKITHLKKKNYFGRKQCRKKLLSEFLLSHFVHHLIKLHQLLTFFYLAYVRTSYNSFNISLFFFLTILLFVRSACFLLSSIIGFVQIFDFRFLMDLHVLGCPEWFDYFWKMYVW